AAAARAGELWRELAEAGIRLRDFDVGGGLGIAYDDGAEPDVGAYTATLAELASGLRATLLLEPGRHLVGPVGTFVTRVLHVKQAGSRTIVVCDGGSNDLLRPALYGAEHPITVLAGGERERATGAVGPVTLELLRERGYQNLRAFASARSAGKQLDGLTVEEATPEVLSAGDLDVCLFSIGTAASRELVPHAVRGGAVAIDKSSAYRLEPGIPLVVPEVNAERALEHDGILANPNCCTIPLTCVLKPLHEEAGLARVRVATYQSVSGAGATAMERLRNEAPAEHDLRMDWDYDGEE